jgi:hypothetical protein
MYAYKNIEPYLSWADHVLYGGGVREGFQDIFYIRA